MTHLAKFAAHMDSSDHRGYVLAHRGRLRDVCKDIWLVAKTIPGNHTAESVAKNLSWTDVGLDLLARIRRINV
jgi:hypothetical protein